MNESGGGGPQRVRRDEAIVEIVSDSGEGAQKAGQTLGAVCAKMGNGVWTVEIIPAEIKPPARSRAGASGIRVRFGSDEITNMGDEADLVVAFNEQVLYGRIEQDAYRPGTVVLLDSKWADDPAPEVRAQFADALAHFEKHGLVVKLLPMYDACLAHTKNPRLGRNMFVLGMLCQIYGRSIDVALAEVKIVFGRKGDAVVELNQNLVRAGHQFAAENVDFAYEIPSEPSDVPRIVLNGNQAVGLGVMASGMDVVSMYPITPATSASHYIASVYHHVGGCLHQAEDEIAAIGFAIGASYAGKTACTITSGPGLALKTEFVGFACMAEIPLVIVLVQRGGPSTGLPTKVEQADLLASLYGEPGDAPKVVLAAATIEECLHLVVTSRRIAEAFRTPVILLTDANLATGVQNIPRPEIEADWFAPPLDQSPWDPAVEPYAWDPETGISPRPIPGQQGGQYVLTGLAHTRKSKVAYDPQSNQTGCEMRSLKLAALEKTLRPPEVFGPKQGELLVVGWGSTLGAINDAVKRLQGEGLAVSATHLRFLSPLEPGLPELFSGFKRVMTIEINYSDPPDRAPYNNGATRRRAQLANVLRAETLVDVDSWSVVQGRPLQPREVYQAIKQRLEGGDAPVTAAKAKEGAA